MSNPMTLLNEVNAETVGDPWEVAVGRPLTFATFPNGPGTGTVGYEGSLDGSHWFALWSGGLYVSTTPVKYIRARYSGSTGTGVVTAQALQSDFSDA